MTGGIVVPEGLQTYFFTAVDPTEVSTLAPRHEPNESRQNPIHITVESDTQRHVLVRLETRAMIPCQLIAEKLLAFDYREIPEMIESGEILCEKKEFLSGWIQWSVSGSMVSQKKLPIKIRHGES